MAQAALQHAAVPPTSFATSYLPHPHQTHTSALPAWAIDLANTPPSVTHTPAHRYSSMRWASWQDQRAAFHAQGLGSTGKGILIGMLSAFGSAAVVGIVIAIVYFFRYTSRGKIFLDRMSRPGEFDDEQQFLLEEEEAMAGMDELQRNEYLRAKAFVQANPPESLPTDISLSQFLAIQEKGVSAWEFEPELEIANCFVENRTEIEFFDSECSVQSNLPIPKQNEVYYWEAKLYDKPESTLLHIGLTTKPYPLFRLPGFHRYSLAYTSPGARRFNQPFASTPYGPTIVQGDVIGCGYRPRTGTVFFTRNGKKLEDVAHGLKSQNFFPTIGANGPASVHVNFGQMGFVFLEANVKKWGLAPQTGSLAPPPPYGSEAGSILLEGGREGVREGMGYVGGHGRTNSAQVRLARGPQSQARSPGPQRSPTDISLSRFNIVDEEAGDAGRNSGEGSARRASTSSVTNPRQDDSTRGQETIDPPYPPADDEYEDDDENDEAPPPDYESPEDGNSTPRASESDDRARLLPPSGGRGSGRERSPPIPTYEAATGSLPTNDGGSGGGRGRSGTRD